MYSVATTFLKHLGFGWEDFSSFWFTCFVLCQFAFQYIINSAYPFTDVVDHPTLSLRKIQDLPSTSRVFFPSPHLDFSPLCQNPPFHTSVLGSPPFTLESSLCLFRIRVISPLFHSLTSESSSPPPTLPHS